MRNESLTFIPHPLYFANLSGQQLLTNGLEAKPQLKFDAAITGIVAAAATAAKTAEAALCRDRLTEPAGVQISDRISQIDLIKEVVEIQSNRQIIRTSGFTAAESAESAAAATASAASAAATTRSAAFSGAAAAARRRITGGSV